MPKTKKPTAPDPAPDALLARYGPIQFSQGVWHIIGGDGLLECHVRAFFRRDPKGFQGLGATAADAEAMLRSYAGR